MIQYRLKFLLIVTLALTSPLFSQAPPEAWNIVAPYLMPEDHPLKETLDALFSSRRVLENRNSLVASGFENKNPEPRTGVFVLRHNTMHGYIFKIYTDDRLSYYRNQPEYITWMLRARGARLLQQEIRKQKWDKYFKVPNKWIYALPSTPLAFSGSLSKNFILVEEEMDIFSNEKSKKKWKDGTMTPSLLNKLFFLITQTGLRGGCKYDNIPFCKDGRIAFIDTQNNLAWPLPYNRLFPVLEGKLLKQWKKLIKREQNIKTLIKKENRI